MVAIVDNLIAARIIYLLVLPFNKWEAFKEGIIDDVGERTTKEGDSDNWSMLHRLVARLKKMLGAFPGGKSMIASIGAAYLLVRECLESNIEPQLLEEWYLETMSLNESMSFETYNFVSNTLKNISEDVGVAVSSVSGIGAPDEAPGKIKKKKKVMKRNDSIPTPP